MCIRRVFEDVLEEEESEEKKKLLPKEDTLRRSDGEKDPHVPVDPHIAS